MPKAFYSSVEAITSVGTELYTIPTERTCRDGWFNAISRSAKERGYNRTHQIVRSKATLWIDELQTEAVYKLCAALQERWYPSITFSAGYVESKSIFIESRYELQIESEGTPAIGAMWWLILLYRLNLFNKEEFDIDNLVKNSPSEHQGIWYNSYYDKGNHVALLEVFHTVSDAKLWLDIHITKGACYGPNNYLAYIAGQQ
jgi:hypothetical protein